eukprot:365761-Chlamydomonas_euryale.AAC.7
MATIRLAPDRDGAHAMHAGRCQVGKWRRYCGLCRTPMRFFMRPRVDGWMETEQVSGRVDGCTGTGMGRGTGKGERGEGADADAAAATSPSMRERLGGTGGMRLRQRQLPTIHRQTIHRQTIHRQTPTGAAPKLKLPLGPHPRPSKAKLKLPPGPKPRALKRMSYVNDTCPQQL